MAALVVQLLSNMRVEVDGTELEVGPPRAAALLAYLLLHGDTVHARGPLACLLWPALDEPRARTNLRQALHHLRQALPGSAGLLEVDADHVAWRRDVLIDLDVGRFETAIANADRACQSGDEPDERAYLETAVRYYRGDLLPESPEPWIQAERERLRQRYSAVLVRLIVLLEHQGDRREALEHAHRLVRHDPLAEAGYRCLIRDYTSRGDRAAALEAYEAYVHVLRSELGREPSPAMRALPQQLLCSEPGATAPPTGDARRDVVPFVGRSDELKDLREAWQAADAGAPSLVLVRGEPGIGKSRLVVEMLLGLRDANPASAFVRCHDGAGALSYAPVSALLRHATLARHRQGLARVWRQQIARLLPESEENGLGDDGGPLTAAWQRLRLFEALARAVLAVQPILVVIDDLHWCDRDSLEWLHYLLRFDARARLLVVATARSHELRENPALLELLSALRMTDQLHEFEVPPLDETESGDLAHSVSGRELSPKERAQLFAETEGNPLFVVETVRAGAGWSAGSVAASAADRSLPPKLRAVIALRFTALAEETRVVVKMAAVIGRSFDFPLLVKLTGWGEDKVVAALDALLRQFIVREVEAGEYEFSHDKLREVAYAANSRTRLRLLHRRVARELAARDAGDQDATSARVAYHFDRGDDPTRAIPYYLRSAAVAQRLFANDEAEGAYRRALALLGALPTEARLSGGHATTAAQVHEGLGDILTGTGQGAAARSQFEQALNHLAGQDLITRARLWWKRGATWAREHQFDEAAAAYDAAESALGDTPDGGDHDAWWQAWIEIHLLRSFMRYWQLRWDTLADLAERVEPVVREHGSARQRGRFHGIMALMVLARDRYVVSDDALRHQRVALAAAEETQDLGVVANARFELGFGLLWHGDAAEAEAHLRAALASTDRTGDPVLRMRSLTYLCYLHRSLGDPDAVRSYAPEALRRATDLSMPEYVGAAHGHRAWLARRDGDSSACEHEALVALAAWRSGQTYPFQWVARMPLLAVRVGEDMLAEALVDAAAMLEERQQRLPDAVHVALVAALEAGHLQDDAAAAARLAEAVRAAERSGHL